MTKADEDAIRDIELRFNEAWGRHDADGMVESLADDAQFVTVNGAWTKTRADALFGRRRRGSLGLLPGGRDLRAWHAEATSEIWAEQ
jgi:hypothetical protein